MKLIQAIVVTATAVISLGGAMLSWAADESYDSTSVFGGNLPSGYRDWKLISVAHEEGKLNDIRAILGNDIAVKAYREGKLPFPDGAIIARIAWSYVPSEENNRAFGRAQSFVAGTPTNVQFMVKNSHDYASTGGWGYTQFSGGKSTHVDVQACYGCHVPVKDRDFLFTRYSP
ncbi:cytochrome P460 family protein [Dyella sp. GSA-30]|uniref:cytochrome P460 family protein n=1 Tax=Dyella sp. GSA-30 TaxID=2994496 RepID=UPI00248FF4BC|nr:cytochrome P460 family protein [Dyella sp. GSA-30]